MTVSLPILMLPVATQRYSCHGCGNCCRDFTVQLRDADLASYVAELEPHDLLMTADDARLDRVAEAFALVIDAKSPYTFRHSERVAEIAVAITRQLDHRPSALRDMRQD